MSGRSSALRLTAIAIVLVTGVALATPVPVLTVTSDDREMFARLDDGAALTYSYRQSIYQVPVYEDFVRVGDRIELLRVRSSDIRSIEYFRWDEDIVQDADGLWTAQAPHSEQVGLVIRITQAGEQHMTSREWTIDMRERFGESVVRVRAEHRPLALLLARGVR